MIMDDYFTGFKNILFFCLFSSTIFYWFSLKFQILKKLHDFARINSIFATFLLFFFLLNRWVTYGYFPISNLYESLLFLSCLLLIIHQILEYQTQSRIFGALLLPSILFITSFADLTLPLEMQKATALVPSLQSNWLMMHVSLMLLSYAILLLGSLFSIIFLVLFLPSERKNEINDKLKIKTITKKSIFAFYNIKAFEPYIPSTEFLFILDNWSYKMISLGFPLLTIGIIAGAVWANEAWGSYWSWDPKETWALITWLVFAAYLHIRLIKGWSGKGPAILASLGFFFIWVCYLGVNFLGQGLHSYGWLSTTT
uniref:Cytochrome c biogenesis protein CcsA n=1 Tax=Dictyopteris divaricata TaxID=156996 RepID=A0A2I4Q2E4_9PHAE|nr:cytochrome c biogenesis protein [Dictyopteris divaricata]YP_010205298.1 cytochrome c biogenesis protein [Grateloupia livida]AQZ25009.1 cytochrome c biogenesis protein [Dictyopteris divaricata]UAV85867.1 cytochrome c biogenesis protein [Grateloupia livida]